MPTLRLKKGDRWRIFFQSASERRCNQPVFHLERKLSSFPGRGWSLCCAALCTAAEKQCEMTLRSPFGPAVLKRDTALRGFHRKWDKGMCAVIQYFDRPRKDTLTYLGRLDEPVVQTDGLRVIYTNVPSQKQLNWFSPLMPVKLYYIIKLWWATRRRGDKNPQNQLGTQIYAATTNHYNIKPVFLWIAHHVLKSLSLRFCEHPGARRRCSHKGKKSCFVLVRPSALTTAHFC